MSEENNSNSGAPTQPSNEGFQEVPHEQLMKMSGEEVKAYHAREKASKEMPSLKSIAKDVSQSKQKELREDAPPSQEIAKKYKVKVQGEELEVDEAELLKGYSHQRAANKLLQEGKKAKQDAEQIVNLLRDKNGLFEAMTKLGHDPYALASEYLMSQIEEQQMDPRDKELRDAKAKLKQIEDMERIQREKIEAERHEQLKKRYEEDYTNQFLSALKTSGLPQTRGMVAEMAKYIAQSAKIGFKMEAHEAAQLVKEDVIESQRRLLYDADAESLVKLLGDNVVNKFREYDVKKIKTPNQILQTPQQQNINNDRKPKERDVRMSSAQWRKFNQAK
jgi:hypothetical protein